MLAASVPCTHRVQPPACPTRSRAVGPNHTTRSGDTHADFAVALADFATIIAPTATTGTSTSPSPGDTVPSAEPQYAPEYSFGQTQTQTSTRHPAKVPSLSTWAATPWTQVHVHPSLETSLWYAPRPLFL